MKPISWRFFYITMTKRLPLYEIVDELRDFDERFAIILHKHVAALGWWCILHFFIALPGLFLAKGWLWYFMLMNLSWAAINFAIAWWMYDHVYMRRFQHGNVYKRFEVQQHVEKMLLFNVGLDASYIFAGLYLLTLSRLPDIAHVALWAGFGWSVILQGVYLFIHDNFFYRLHFINFRTCKPFLENIIEAQLSLRRYGV
jgi:hypothetical protein